MKIRSCLEVINFWSCCVHNPGTPNFDSRSLRFFQLPVWFIVPSVIPDWFQWTALELLIARARSPSEPGPVRARQKSTKNIRFWWIFGLKISIFPTVPLYDPQNVSKRSIFAWDHHLKEFSDRKKNRLFQPEIWPSISWMTHPNSKKKWWKKLSKNGWKQREVWPDRTETVLERLVFAKSPKIIQK